MATFLALQTSFAGRDQAQPIYCVFLCHSLQYFLRIKQGDRSSDDAD